MNGVRPHLEAPAALREVVVVLQSELLIFRKLLNKNRNQHRHGIYFRKLVELNRRLKELDPTHAKKIILAAHDYVDKDTTGSEDAQAGSSNSTLNPSALRVLEELSVVANAAHRAIRIILDASTSLAGLIGAQFHCWFSVILELVMFRPELFHALRTDYDSNIGEAS